MFQDPRCNYSSPGLTSIDSAVESWDSGVVDHTNNEQTNTQDLSMNNMRPQTAQQEEPSQFNLKKHESQLLFYSDVEDSLCPSPLPLPNYNFTNTLQSKYDSSYFFCSKPSLSSRNEYGKFRYWENLMRG